MTNHSVYALAADYKYRGMDKFRAWDQYIIDSGLKPEVDAGEFYSVFNSVTPCQLYVYKKPSGFVPTHLDTLFGNTCSITTDNNLVFQIIWEDGHTGSYPACYPPPSDRFVLIVDPHDKYND